MSRSTDSAADARPAVERNPFRPLRGRGGAEETARSNREAQRDLDRLALIIPAHDEVDGIAETVSSARESLARMGIEAQVIVVDDGSADATAEAARRAGATIIRHLYRRGYGHALRSGILAAACDTIAICDADGTYPLQELPRLLEAFGRGYDLVIAARTGHHFRGNHIKGVARRIFRRMCESATGEHIPDANSGFRVFSRERILPYLPMMCGGFSFTTSQTLVFMLRSHSVEFVPISYGERIGKTKVRHLRDSLRTAQYICQMYVIFNPVKLFTIFASLPIIGGLLLSTLALSGLLPGVEPSVPDIVRTMATCGGLGLLLFGMGLSIFATGRQQWPEVVSGVELGTPSRTQRACAES